MQSVDFKGSNVIMKGDGATVADVPAFRNSYCCTTAWQFTQDEIDEINRTGRLYLTVFSNGSMPPVALLSETATRALIVDFGATFPKQD